MGWILETNKSMNRAMEGMGGTVVQPLPVLRADCSGRVESLSRCLGRGAGLTRQRDP